MNNIKYIKGEYHINGIEVLSDKMEKVGYGIIETSEFIDELISWISEAKQCKEMMKDDLKYLMSLNDQYIFSSTDTNEYIAKSDDLERFNEIAKNLTK